MAADQLERLSFADFVSSKLPEKGPNAAPTRPTPPRQGSSNLRRTFADAYEIGQEIGSGNFSKVIAVKPRDGHAIHDPAVNARLAHIKRRETLACKMLELPIDGVKPAKGQTTRHDALRELDQLLELPPHDSVITLVDFYLDGNKVHLITELGRGGDLKQALEARGSFCEEDARAILKSVLSGLAHLHKHGVAHRDLKLENILMTSEDGITEVKIADLGMSKRLSVDTKHTVCGTPMFMAPEVLVPAQTDDAARYGKVSIYDVKADVWSAGVMGFMLLAGHPPFEGNGVYDLFKAIRARKIDFSDPVWELVSDEARDFVNYILVNDPKQRPSAEEALQHPWLTME